MSPEREDGRPSHDNPRDTKRARRTSWAPPELVAVALIVTAVFSAVASIVSFVGELPPMGWRETIGSWTDWATQPWLPVLLLLASLVAWHTAKTCGDGLFEAGDLEASRTEENESDRADGCRAVQLWDRARRFLVIAGVAAVLGAVAGLAVILAVVDSELPGPRTGLPTSFAFIPEGAVAWSKVAVAFSGVAELVPALATVVVFRYVLRIWRDLTYLDDSIGDQVDVPN
jgi:hypothetical protein